MEMITVRFPNIGEQEIALETVKKWNPEDVEYIGRSVFFINNTSAISMEIEDFERIFKK